MLINTTVLFEITPQIQTETLSLKHTEVIQAISEVWSTLPDLSPSPLNQQFHPLAENWYFIGSPMVFSTTQMFSSSLLSCSTQHTKH